jgi:hypothetical protein
MAKTFLSHESRKVQSRFREWYGSLSILELAANPKLTNKIREIENQLESLKGISEINQKTKLKLNELETDLSFLWELLTPTEQSRQLVFDKFLELQKEVRAMSDRNLTNKGIQNEQAK